MSNHLQTQDLSNRLAERITPEGAKGLSLSSKSGGINLENMSQVMDLAKMMAVSDIAVRPHLRNNAGACLAIAVQAFEWEMSPFAVANKSYAVNNQISYEAQLIHAVILMRAPIKGRLKTEYSGVDQKRQLRVWAETLDGEMVDYLSPEIGSIKPKNSPLWVNDPDQQLFYFSARAFCRRHFPDVILGVYARDEIEGSQEMRDVTPVETGLAARLANSNDTSNGFDANGITNAIDDVGAQESASPKSHTAAEASQREIVSENGEVIKSVEGDATEKATAQAAYKIAPADPETINDAQSAARDGLERAAPDVLDEDQTAHWYAAYDAQISEGDGE